jgi:His/Glu/Gln/Arg/opine family amino acid ABC transporter permease subunit
MKFDYLSIVEYWPLVFRGLWLTLAASGLGLIFSLVIGAIVAMARLSRSRIVAWAATTYVEFGRNLPFIIVLFLLFYVLPAYGFRLPAFAVGVIALSLYAGAYFAEIIRGAIRSVPQGQMESARAVGMSRAQALRHVVFPQMIGYFIPPATNQAVMVVKESSILSTITVTELTMVGQIIQGYTYTPIEIFVTISLLYWLLCTGISRIGSHLEVLLQPRRHKVPAVKGSVHA